MRLHYNATQRIERPHFGFAMETVDGAYLWGNNTKDLQFEISHLEGRGAVDLTVPKLPLQPGTLNLTLRSLRVLLGRPRPRGGLSPARPPRHPEPPSD